MEPRDIIILCLVQIELLRFLCWVCGRLFPLKKLKERRMDKKEIANLLNKNIKMLRITTRHAKAPVKRHVDALILDNVTAIISLVDDSDMNTEGT